MSLVQHAIAARLIAAKTGNANSVSGANSPSVGSSTAAGTPSPAAPGGATKRSFTEKIARLGTLSKGRKDTAFRTPGASTSAKNKPAKSCDAPAIPTGYAQAPDVGNVTASHEPTLPVQHQPADASMHHHLLGMVERHHAMHQSMLDMVTKAAERVAESMREGAQAVESASGE